MQLDDSALRERARTDVVGPWLKSYFFGPRDDGRLEELIAVFMTKMIDEMSIALRDATQLEWEGRAASLADVLNQELRENGPLGVYQVGTHDDMREGIRVLVDYVREVSARVAQAEQREAAIEIIKKFLLFNSQRSVSWHEVQDCIAAIRNRGE